jgi:hypothetical protein
MSASLHHNFTDGPGCSASPHRILLSTDLFPYVVARLMFLTLVEDSPTLRVCTMHKVRSLHGMLTAGVAPLSQRGKSGTSHTSVCYGRTTSPTI